MGRAAWWVPRILSGGPRVYTLGIQAGPETATSAEFDSKITELGRLPQAWYTFVQGTALAANILPGQIQGDVTDI